MKLVRRILVTALATLALPAVAHAQAERTMTCTFDGARGSMTPGSGGSFAWQTTATCVMPNGWDPPPTWFYPDRAPRVVAATITASGTYTKTACGTYGATGTLSMTFNLTWFNVWNRPYTLDLVGGQGVLRVPSFAPGYTANGRATFLPNDLQCVTHDPSLFSLSGELVVTLG